MLKTERSNTATSTPDVLMGHYEPVDGWAKLPHGTSFASAATAVAVDSQDRVVVFNRGNHPIVIFDDDGTLLSRWGDPSSFVLPHAVTVTPEDHLLLVDAKAHRIEKRSQDGELLMVLGGEAPAMSGKPFNLPADVAVHPSTGDLFVADGYGNARVHRFDGEGRHLDSWGAPGTRAGEFAIPHGIGVVGEDLIAVCDRENSRVQLFGTDGTFVSQWHAYRPASICTIQRDTETLCAVAEFAPPKIALGFPDVGHCIGLYDLEGQPRGRLGGPFAGDAVHEFINPHSVAANSRGEIYVAEASAFVLDQMGLSFPAGREIPTLRKWRPVAGLVQTADGVER